jgi:DNA-binding GntR family transcriptional regulator
MLARRRIGRTPEHSMQRSRLATRIADDICAALAHGTLGGGHLSAQKLADRFGVSRSPVREAMGLLAERGVVERIANRGYFARAAAPPAQGGPANPFEAPGDYQRIAEDWLADRIPGEVTERFLRERYRLSRTRLADILLRAVREGWAERKPGYGWRLLPVAKTAQAFAQIYRLRLLIEPAALLEPGFRIDPSIIAEQRRIQTRMLEHDIEALAGEALLDRGALFHEELIRMCGNAFFHQTLVRLNRMRRLLEYRARVDRRRLYTQCAQHLELLRLLEQGQVAEAAALLRRHLEGALAVKSPVAVGR